MLHIILFAIVPIIVVMTGGYLSGRMGVFNGQNAKAFNKVVLDYALPAALFVSIVDATRQMLIQDLKLLAVSFSVIIGCFLAVYFIYKYCFKGNTGADAAVMALLCGSPTIGFLGFAVLEPIFGTTPYVALVVAIVGIVCNAIIIPMGLSLLNAGLSQNVAAGGGKKEKHNPWKPVVSAMCQPVAWAPILAVAWVVAGIPWPAYLSPSFDLIKGANASMAVFAAGVTLSAFRFTVNWQSVLGSILKLVFMPAVLLVVGILCRMDPLNLKMLVVAGTLPPAFSGAIISDEYNTYVQTGTSSLALSVVLFMGFCPLWIWLTDWAIKAFL